MRINVAYAVPPTSVKHANWHDGFTAAMDIVAERHDVSWLNVHPHSPGSDAAARGLFECDFLLVKSNFGWIPDVAYMWRDLRATSRPPVGLMISGSIPPRPTDFDRFEVLFYETEWFGNVVRAHPRALHAFGVDVDVMKLDRDDEIRDIDWLIVGRPAAFKHPEALLGRVGTRMLVGETSGAECVVAGLRNDGIEVLDFVPYEKLAQIYRRTKVLLVATELQGGGERAVLEARACGVEIHLLADNPKLTELLSGPIPSHRYYASQLLTGMEGVVADLGSQVTSTRVHAGKRLAADKVARVPHALGWRASRLVGKGRRLFVRGLMQGR